MLEKIALVVVGAILGGLGQLVLRYLRKDRVTEELARRRDAATTIQHLRDTGVTMEETEAVLVSLGRRPTGALPSPPRDVTAEDRKEAQEFAAIEAAQSQAEMNHLQVARARRLHERMTRALNTLRQNADAETLAKLNEAQAAWEMFRDREAELAGLPWEDGTMQPFIVAGMMSRLTKQRAEQLETALMTEPT